MQVKFLILYVSFFTWLVLPFQTVLAADHHRIPNFHQLNENIMRGGRPNNRDLSFLKKSKVKTIINLENNMQAVNIEQRAAKALGLTFISLPMDWLTRPSDQLIDQILDLLRDTNNFPIFIHCTHGQDRTGLVIGLHRFFDESWRPEDAYKEMLQLGFHTEFEELDSYFKTKTNWHPVNLLKHF